MTSHTNEESNIAPIISDFKKMSEQVQDLDETTKATILEEFCRIADIELEHSTPKKAMPET